MMGETNLKVCLQVSIFLLGVGCTAAAGQIIYVDADAPGVNDGSSWADAYKYLQDALADANSGDEIHVAEGIYTPDSNSAEPNGTGDREATFQLINEVTLQGGYAGYNEPDPDAQDIEAYETILSGDLNGDDIDVDDPCDLLNEPTRFENSYHVVTAIRKDAVLRGFTITGGNANGSDPWPFTTYDRGGGIYIDTSSWKKTKVSNCIFTRNSSVSYGGGMYYVRGGNIINCVFSKNWAGAGGGVYGGCSMPSRTPILTNCRFLNNSAVKGGGICIAWSRPTLDNCMFIGNSAEFGGAAAHYDSAVATYSKCTFNANSASYGKAIFCSCWYSRLPNVVRLNNCIVWNGGKEIYNDSNCVSSPGPAPAASQEESSNEGDLIITIIYSDMQGGWPGAGNIDVDPCFADVNNGDYHLRSQAGRWDADEGRWTKDEVTSPCIDAGNPTSPIGLEPFPNGGRANMGAYGGTSEASKSYFGEPVCETIVAGDINGDCKVNFEDFAVMAFHWLEDNSFYREVPEFYYYSSNRKIYLDLYTAMISVYFEDTVSREQKEALIESDPALEEIMTELPRYGLGLVGTKAGSSNIDIIQTIERLEKLPEVRYSTPVFGYSHTKLILTDEFIAKFKPDVTEEEIEAFNKLNAVEIEDKIEGIEHYILRVKDPKNMNMLKMANLYYESPITIFSVPNYIAIGEPP